MPREGAERAQENEPKSRTGFMLNVAATKAKQFLGRAVGWGFIAVGALLVIVGIFLLARSAVVSMQYSKTSGQVLSIERSESVQGGTVFHPVFKFTDVGGIVHTQRASFGSSFLAMEPGDRVSVLFEASKPERARINSFQSLWFGPLALIGFGLVFSGFAYLWLFLLRSIARVQQAGRGE